MKYIVTESNDEFNTQEIFIFPRTIDHDAYAESVHVSRNKTWGDWERLHKIPIAAGFIDSNSQCYGRSETLGLDSRGAADTKLIKFI